MDICACILDRLISEELSLSHIVMLANLNHRAAKGYLREMVADGLIRPNKSKFVVYSITEEGVRWLKHYKTLKRGGRGKNKEGTDFQ
jgi:predicted transcriptional regulator